MSTPASLPYAFVAKIVAADGQHDALADLLAGAVALANEEVGTIVWFAVRTHADTSGSSMHSPTKPLATPTPTAPSSQP